MWDFVYEGKVISAKIEDTTWLSRVQAGYISFSSGSLLETILRIEAETDNNGTLTGNVRYFVVMVTNSVKPIHQEDLPNISLDS